MKNTYGKIYLLFLAAALTCTSCDYLDRDMGDSLSADDLFSRTATAEGYINNAYTCLQDFMYCTEDNGSRFNLGGATDELGYQAIVYGSASPYGINTGSWSPSSMPLRNCWSEYYQCIRRCNTLIANYDKIPEEISVSGINRKVRMLGEAYGLRGYYHWLLFRNWGGIPVLKETVDPGDEEKVASLRRETPENTVKEIISDLEKAYEYLPVKNEDINYGRMTRVVVKALISQVKLFWASPLWNPDNDSSRWSDASDATVDALNYALDNGHNLAPRYSDLFSNILSNEYIWTKNSILSECFYWDYYHFPAGYGGVAGVEGVLQEMVDAFEMNATGEVPVLGYDANGEPILNPKATDYDPANPWKGRDPRFYYDIMCHNDALQGGYIDTSEGSEARSSQNPTFYYVRKYTDVNHNLIKNYSELAFTYRRYAIIRTAELYLNAAEALNECEGASARVTEYVNKVRRRAGCAVEIPNGLKKEEMREKIRQERRVELCFEGQRFFDVRRWDIAREIDNVPVHRVEVEVERDENGEKIYDEDGRTIVKKISYPVYQKRSFKANLFPIPQTEIDKNNYLNQNSEWL